MHFSMIRVRFQIKFKDCGEDYRPVKWPIKYPYWCTGQTDDAFTLMAYADDIDYILNLWPEASRIEIYKADKIEFSSRFPKPNWYNDTMIKKLEER